MIFEVKEFKDVKRFNIGRSENKMAANKAEIWYLNGYISSSITARDPILVSTLWFSRYKNLMISSDLKLDEQKTRCRSIWLKFDV